MRCIHVFTSCGIWMYPCIHLMWHPRHAHIYTSGLALLVHTVKGMCLPYRKGTDGTIGPQSSRSLSRVLSRFLSHAFPHTFLRNFSDALSLSCARGWLYGLARPHNKCVCARARERVGGDAPIKAVGLGFTASRKFVEGFWGRYVRVLALVYLMVYFMVYFF